MRNVIIPFLLVMSIGAEARVSEPDELPLRNWDIPAATRVSGAAFVGATDAVPSGPTTFIPVVPCRLVDTRLAAGPYGGPSLVADSAREFNIPANPCNVPLAAAYSLNITATRYQARGFITAYPTGATIPGTSTLNFGDPPAPPALPPSVANAAIVPAASNGSVSVYAFSTTDVVIDINGYFAEGVVAGLTTSAPVASSGVNNRTLGITPGGITSNELGPNSVTTGAIKNGTISADKIAGGQVVKSFNGLKDDVTIVGSGSAQVTTVGSTITVSMPPVPTGTILLGQTGDTTLINGGYSEIGPNAVEYWRRTSMTNVPFARGYHSTVWTGTQMIVFGGLPGITNSGGRYDPATDTWTATSTTNAPAGRSAHTAIWTGTRMVVWGGYAGSGPFIDFNTGGQYDPATNTWTPTTTFGAPAVRRYHSAVWSGTYMVVFGGYSGNTWLNSGGRYRPAFDDWLPMSTTNTPTPRSGPAVWNTATNTMIVWGGNTNVIGSENTGGRYDPVNDIWTPTSMTNAPAGRAQHTLVWTGSRMIVWGGSGPTGATNTGALYNPATDTWTTMSTNGAPVGRVLHEATWIGDRMLIWGGTDNFNYTNTGGTYDPSTDSWGSPTTMTNAPDPRSAHSQIWTGTRLIVWGGYGGPNQASRVYVNTGAQWGFLSVYRKN